MGTATLGLLDRFTIGVPGDAPPLLPIGLQRLLACLALRGPAPRSVVAGTLWPDVPEEHALARLRTGVWRINKLIPDALVADGTALTVSSAVEVDTQRQEWFATALLERRMDESSLRTGFAVLLPAALLPGWDDEWVVVERERLSQLRLHALEAAVRVLLQGPDVATALRLALEAVRAGPLREAAHAALIQVYLAEGNASDAIRQHRRFAALLRSELALDPSPRFAALLPAGAASGGMAN